MSYGVGVTNTHVCRFWKVELLLRLHFDGGYRTILTATKKSNNFDN